MGDIKVAVYTLEDVQLILGVKRSVAYNFVNKASKDNLFRVMRIGTLIRIEKESFDLWIKNGCQ